MNVAVLLAGVADPKWPLDDAAVAANAGLAAAPLAARIASPFDESALEIALQLRDAAPETRVAVLAPGAVEVEALLRQAAAHRPAALLRIAESRACLWDARARAALLKAAIGGLAEAPGLVLVGREFGDADDGTVPACLAEELGWTFLARVRQVRTSAAGFVLVREHGGAEERVTCAGPVLASVTNDRGNRLRHPLLKNVMAARREPIAVIDPGTAREAAVQAIAAVASRAKARQGAGRRLEGPLEDGIAELASLLRSWRESR